MSHRPDIVSDGHSELYKQNTGERGSLRKYHPGNLPSRGAPRSLAAGSMNNKRD
jgi:hypothetical protein